MTEDRRTPRRRPIRLSINLEPRDRRTLEEVAREHMLIVLGACNNNMTNAARVLGIDRKTLARSLQRWGISQPAERKRLRPGALVAIEGLDGAGLTTQARRLVAHLEAHGHRALYTCEPSDGPVGSFVRRLLATPKALEHACGLRTLSLLFAADRVDHFHRVVGPKLRTGVHGGAGGRCGALVAPESSPLATACRNPNRVLRNKKCLAMRFAIPG